MSTQPPWQEPSSQPAPPSQIPPWDGPPISSPPNLHPSPQPRSSAWLYVVIGGMVSIILVMLGALFVPGSPVAIVGDGDDEEQPTISQSEAAERFIRAAFSCDIDYVWDHSCTSLRNEIDLYETCTAVSVGNIRCTTLGADRVECSLVYTDYGDLQIGLVMQGNDVCDIN